MKTLIALLLTTFAVASAQASTCDHSMMNQLNSRAAEANLEIRTGSDNLGRASHLNYDQLVARIQGAIDQAKDLNCDPQFIEVLSGNLPLEF